MRFSRLGNLGIHSPMTLLSIFLLRRTERSFHAFNDDISRYQLNVQVV